MLSRTKADVISPSELVGIERRAAGIPIARTFMEVHAALLNHPSSLIQFGVLRASAAVIWQWPRRFARNAQLMRRPALAQPACECVRAYMRTSERISYFIVRRVASKIVHILRACRLQIAGDSLSRLHLIFRQ